MTTICRPSSMISSFLGFMCKVDQSCSRLLIDEALKGERQQEGRRGTLIRQTLASYCRPCVRVRTRCLHWTSFMDSTWPYLTYSNFILLHLHVLICAAGHCQKPWWILASKKKAGFHCKYVPCHYVRLWSCCQCRLCIQSDLYIRTDIVLWILQREALLQNRAIQRFCTWHQSTDSCWESRVDVGAI